MTRPSLSFFSLAFGAFALPVHAEVPRVVTDVPVVGALVQQVMGDLGRPDILLEAGGDPHSYSLRPSQARSLQNADLLIWVGPELTPWLARPAENLAAGSHSMTLLDLPATRRHEYADAHEHEHEHEHDDHGHDHVHSGTDPHAWLDPANGQAWLEAIAEALAARDPDHAAVYTDNAAKAAAEISALDAELRALLAPAKGKRFVVFHDAYGYFTAHYGLEPAIAVSLGDASTPSAGRLEAIRNEISSQGAVCAFPEANHDPRLIAAATEGTEVRQGEALDPEGSGAPADPNLYPAVLRGLGKALADCLNQG